MAQITITTTDEQDRAIKYAADVYNAQAAESSPNQPPDPLTPLQFFRRHVFHKVDAWVRDLGEASKATRGELFTRATAEDQAAIDAILAKYQA
jgi:hypothetical protein